MGRPGIMLYFDILEPVRNLSDAERGRLLLAMLEYGQMGVQPEFAGMLAVAWGFIRPKLDRDNEEYRRSTLRRKYAAACRERKRNGLKYLCFEDWVKETSPIIDDDLWYPTTSASATTSASVSAAAAATAEDQEDAAATADRKLKMLGGKLGKGVVLLSDAQMEDLLEQMGLEVFDFYVDKLSSFILEKGARVASHYDTILKWWRSDSNLGRKRR